MRDYPCPQCNMGHLRPTRSAYVRRMGKRLVTMPNFSLWRCDFCGYTRYDVTALARVELLLGPNTEDIDEEESLSARRQGEGPANRGPQRWSS